MGIATSLLDVADNVAAGFLSAVSMSRDGRSIFDQGAPVWNEGGGSMVYQNTSSGETITPARAYQLSAYYACVRNIAEDCAKLPLGYYERAEDGGKERLHQDRLDVLLNLRPNPEMSAMAFREAMGGNTVGWGNGYAEIERDGALVPVALWPIHPSRVDLCRAEDGGIVYRIREDNGAETFIAARDMVHWRGPGADGLLGYSPAALAAESLGVNLAQQKFAGSFFANGTVSSGVIEMPGRMKDDSIALMRRQWATRYGGAGNQWVPLILHSDQKWKSVNMPLREAQFIEGRKFSVEEICRWFRMPPHKVQHLERATFSNIEHQSIDYVVDTLQPWFTRIEQECTIKLVPAVRRGARFFEHMAQALMRGDQAARSAFYSSQFNLGAMSTNEIRKAENRNPVPGGDKRYIPMNMQELGAEPEAAALPVAPAPPPADDDAEDEEPEARRPAATSALGALVAVELSAMIVSQQSSIRKKQPTLEAFMSTAAERYKSRLQAPIAALVGEHGGGKQEQDACAALLHRHDTLAHADPNYPSRCPNTIAAELLQRLAAAATPEA